MQHTLQDMIPAFTSFLRSGNALGRRHIVGPISHEAALIGGPDYLQSIIDGCGGISMGVNVAPGIVSAISDAAESSKCHNCVLAIYDSAYHFAEPGRDDAFRNLPLSEEFDKHIPELLPKLHAIDRLCNFKPTLYIIDSEMWSYANVHWSDSHAIALRHSMYEQAVRMVFPDITIIRFEQNSPLKSWYLDNAAVPACPALYRLWSMDITRSEYLAARRERKGASDAFVALGGGHHWEHGDFRYEWDYGVRRAYEAGRWLCNDPFFASLRFVIPHPSHHRGPVAMEHTMRYLWGAWERRFDSFPEECKFIEHAGGGQ